MCNWFLTIFSLPIRCLIDRKLLQVGQFMFIVLTVPATVLLPKTNGVMFLEAAIWNLATISVVTRTRNHFHFKRCFNRQEVFCSSQHAIDPSASSIMTCMTGVKSYQYTTLPLRTYKLLKTLKVASPFWQFSFPRRIVTEDALMSK